MKLFRGVFFLTLAKPLSWISYSYSFWSSNLKLSHDASAQNWPEGKGLYSLSCYKFNKTNVQQQQEVCLWIKGINGELKQQRRWKLQKGHFKSEFALLQTLSRLYLIVQFVKCWQIFLELNSNRVYRRSGKEKETRCLVIMSFTKVKLGIFFPAS